MASVEEHRGIPRLMWESEHEWKLRTMFMDSNETYFTGDRLAALSMSWANWKFMGNTYGTAVQAILEDCHNRCPEEVDAEINKIREMAIPKVKFVKASSESFGSRTGPPSAGKGKKW